jgi:hypothetical protein
MKLDRGHFRNDVGLKSTDDKLEFRVFLRRSEDLPENFSIGLAFLAKDGSGEVVLLRRNGPHGGYNDSFDPEHPHWDYHVHRASAEMIEAGLRPERAPKEPPERRLRAGLPAPHLPWHSQHQAK